MISTYELEDKKYELQIEPFLKAVFYGNVKACLQFSPSLTSFSKSYSLHTHIHTHICVHTQLNNLHKGIQHK